MVDAGQEYKPVNYFEDFRKAKRNSLVWSSLAMMACLGTEATTTAPTSAGIFAPLGLRFSQMQLIVAAVTAASFFAVSYFRAAQMLVRLSSQALGSAFADLVTAVRDYEEQVRAVMRALADANQIRSTANMQASGRLSQVRFDLEQWQKSISEPNLRHRLDTIVAQFKMDEATPDGYNPDTWNDRVDGRTLAQIEATFRKVINEMRAAVRDWQKEPAAKFTTMVADIQDQRMLPIDSEPAKVVKEYEASLEKVSSLVDGLSRLHSSIGRVDRNWLTFWDHGVVAVAFAGALALSAITIIASDLRWSPSASNGATPVRIVDSKAVPSPRPSASAAIYPPSAQTIPTGPRTPSITEGATINSSSPVSNSASAKR